MADIFISYSKKHPEHTVALAADLEARGYSTWWDTSLLPGDEFPEVIQRQIDMAKAVIVIWTANSVKSQWVRAEAALGYRQRKLITLFVPGLDFQYIPLPFNTLHREPIANRGKLYAALRDHGIAPNIPVQGKGRAPGKYTVRSRAVATLSFRYTGGGQSFREFVQISIEGVVKHEFYISSGETKVLEVPDGFYIISARFTEYVTREVYTNGVVIKSEGSIDGQSETLKIIVESGRSYKFSCDLSAGFGNWLGRTIRRRQGISLTIMEGA
jgi:hypothetical protein